MINGDPHERLKPEAKYSVEQRKADWAERPSGCVTSGQSECGFNLAMRCETSHGSQMSSRAIVMQQKTKRPVQFEITELTRKAVRAWIDQATLKPEDVLFPSRLHDSAHLSTRQYARIVHKWVSRIGLDDSAYGTHTMRRTKASLIYRRTKNLRAVQILLGHTKLESTVRYLGIEVDDALEMAEQTEV